MVYTTIYIWTGSEFFGTAHSDEEPLHGVSVQGEAVAQQSPDLEKGPSML